MIELVNGRGRFSASCAALTALLAVFLLTVSTCGHGSTLPNRFAPELCSAPSEESPAQIPEVPTHTGPLPSVYELDACVVVARDVSQDDTVTSPGIEASLHEQTGTNGDNPELSVEEEGTALTLRAYAPGEYAYAYYGQAIGSAPKPLKTMIDSEVCDYGGGRDDDIPLSYFLGVADYTVGCWRWFGPLGQDVEVTVNSEALKSRFKSPESNFYLCVLASNGSKAASALPADGLVADFPLDPSVRAGSQDEEDPGGLTIELVKTWIGEGLATAPAAVKNLEAQVSVDGVLITWEDNPDPDVNDYQIFRQRVADSPDDPQQYGREHIATVDAPDNNWVDSTADPTYVDFLWEVGTPGREYRYSVRAHKDGVGYGGLADVTAIRPLHPPVVTASDGTHTSCVHVAWTAVEGATGYVVFREDAGELSQVPAATLSYDDEDVELDTIYSYSVQATGEDADGPVSAPDAGSWANAQPTAQFNATPPEGDVPLTVDFDAGESVDSDGSIVKYEWDWNGDGSYDYNGGSSPLATHEYVSPAEYSATLRVTDNDGGTGTANTTISAYPRSWTHTWGSTEGDYAYATAVDEERNVVLAGATRSFSAGDSDVLLAKYSPFGDLVWAKTWGGNLDDVALDAAVDNAGNVYLAGRTESYGAGLLDILFLKFSPAGDILWAKTWGGSGFETMFGCSVFVDGSGNSYIVSDTASYGAGNYDIILLKYSATGSLLWQKACGYGGDERGYDVLADSEDSSVFIAGRTDNVGLGDALLVKLNASGSEVYQKRWGRGDCDAFYRMTLGTGGLYMVGYTWTYDGSQLDAFITKYTTGGTLLWQRAWGESGAEYPGGIAVDPSGNVIVSGYTDGFGAADSEAFALEYSADGTLLHEKIWGGDGEQRYEGAVMDEFGFFYCAGCAPDTSAFWRTISSSIPSRDGSDNLWAATIANVTGSVDAPVGTFADVTGVLDTGGGDDDALIMKIDVSAF